MKIRFWGVRGSHPISHIDYLKYGGNTTCISVEVENQIFIVDAGTGIINLDEELSNKYQKFHLLFTHMHIDHVQGFMFFKPLYSKTKSVNLYGPVLLNNSFHQTIKSLMSGNLFPASVENMVGIKNIKIIENKESTFEFQFEGGKLEIHSKFINVHPRGGVIVYKFIYNNKSFVFATDIESREGGLEELIEFSKNADLLIHDAQYSEEEYIHKKGWGHSTYKMAIENAKKSNVKSLCLTHYNSLDTDKLLDEKYNEITKEFSNLIFAKEGLEINL